MSPILYFLELSWFEPRELPKQAGAQPTQPLISLTNLATYLPSLATHLPNIATHSLT